jgi:hypothetical protein
VYQPLLGHQAVAEQFFAGVPGIVKDDRRLTESIQYMLHQAAKPTRARFSIRLEQAAEGVEIVAVDTGPTTRHSMNQMGIAVIDDVHEVHT